MQVHVVQYYEKELPTIDSSYRYILEYTCRSVGLLLLVVRVQLHQFAINVSRLGYYFKKM